MQKTNYSHNIKYFCKKNNINIKSSYLLKSDASARYYYRLSNFNKKCLLMDSSLESKSIENFIKISKWLKFNGFSSPDIYKKDKNLGILLIEDFKDDKFSILLKKEKEKKNLYYKHAIKVLIMLSKKEKPSFMYNYDNKILKNELRLYLQWYLNISKNKKALNGWDNIWNTLLNGISYKKTSVVLRDFHVDNIFYLKNRKNLKKVGLIDFQDALLGHPAYDLVSLLQDVRVFVSSKEQLNLYNYYIKYSKLDKNEFHYAYLVLGTQRLLKIIGIFKRLSNKEGKANYLKYLPRAKKLIKQNLKNPIFNELKIWLKTYSNHV